MAAEIVRMTNASWAARPTVEANGYLPGDKLVFLYLSSTSKSLTSISGLGATWTIKQTGLVCVAIGSDPQNGTDGKITDNVPQTDSGAACVVFHIRGVTSRMEMAVVTSGSLAANAALAGMSNTLSDNQLMLVIGLNNLALHSSTTPDRAAWANGTYVGAINGWGYADATAAARPVVTRVSSGPAAFAQLILGEPTPDPNRKRYYFSAAAAAVSPAVDPYWDFITPSSFATMQLATAPTNGPIADFSGGSMANTGYDQLMRPYNITVPHKKVISGSFRMVMGAAEQKLADDAFLQCRIRVLKADGTERGILFAGQPWSTELVQTTTLSASVVNTRTISAALSPVAGVLATDLLQVEVGIRKNGSDNGGIRVKIGDPTALPDFTFADGQLATDGRPWVEFQFDPPETAPPWYVGANAVDAVYLGNTEVDAAAFGSVLL